MENNTPPILPAIHLNGTSRKMLAEGYDAIYAALHALEEAWGRCEFNARDYYVHGPWAWEAASEQRYDMARKIRDLKQYIDAHRAHIHT